MDEPKPTRGSPLPNSEREVLAAKDGFTDSRMLRHEQATRAAVLEAMPGYGYTHFSCHGFAHFGDPLKSGLVMAHDEVLTLGDLLDSRLTGRG